MEDEYKNNRIQITKEMLDRARSKSSQCGWMNKKSFRKGDGNLVGFLGEEMIEHEFGKKFDLRKDDEYTHDFSCQIKGIPLRFDVKTKKTSVPYIDGDFEASIVSYQIDDGIQPVDFYVFCRVYFPKDGSDPPFGWIIGKISKRDFIANSTHFKKGEYDKSNDYYVQNDCYNIKYKDMSKFGDFKES